MHQMTRWGRIMIAAILTEGVLCYFEHTFKKIFSFSAFLTNQINAYK